MTELSIRLQKIADRINEGETMADIGTDHGFLTIYLIENDISPSVIMTDVSLPSLMKGSDNLDMLGADRKRADFRVGDGISVLERGETDTVVIAGMGGMLIRDIMSIDMEHTCSFRKYILQPRTRQGHLRKWLLENGFTIIHEDLVEEGRFIPEIITALSPQADDVFTNDASVDVACMDGVQADGVHMGDARMNDVCITGSATDDVHNAGSETYGVHTAAGDVTDDGRLCIRGVSFASEEDTGEDIIYRVPPWITQATGPVEEFIARNIENEKKRLENVMLAKERDIAQEDRICRGIAYLKRLLEEYGNGR